MGTAYGVWSSFVACNNILLEVTAGAVVRFLSSSLHVVFQAKVISKTAPQAKRMSE